LCTHAVKHCGGLAVNLDSKLAVPEHLGGDSWRDHLQRVMDGGGHVFLVAACAVEPEPEPELEPEPGPGPGPEPGPGPSESAGSSVQ
jgi:hypothetical protein